MPTRLAKFFSFIAHPMFMPTYSVVLLFGLNTYINQTIPSKMQFMITLLVFINTCILPIIFILVMLKQKFLTSIYLENQKERILPFVMAFFFFLDKLPHLSESLAAQITVQQWYLPHEFKLE